MLSKDSLIKQVLTSNSLLLFFFALLVLLRAPSIVWPGRLWAEEGSVYFVKFYNSTIIASFFSIELGYYSLFNKLVLISAAKFIPLQYAPIFITFFSLLVMISPVWLWLYCMRDTNNKAYRALIVIALVLFTLPNHEVWLNSVNSQFYLSLSSAIILISSAHNLRMHYVRLIILFIAGMTGVVSCMLLPFFLFELLLNKGKEKLQETMILALASLVQFLCVIVSYERNSDLYIGYLPWVLHIKLWLLPSFGVLSTDIISIMIKLCQLYKYPLLTMLLLVPHVLIGIGLFCYGDRLACYLFLASLIIASVSFFKAVESQNSYLILSHISSLGGARYYYAPNVMKALALFLPQRNLARVLPQYAQHFRALCNVIVMLFILTGACDFLFTHKSRMNCFEGPSWQTEVKNWQEGKSDRINIWPVPWSITLTPTNRNQNTLE